MFDFTKIPDRLKGRVVDEWRKANKNYVVKVINEWEVFGGDCPNCLLDQLKEWITWAIEDGPLKGFGQPYKNS